jgi:hypothetical protein
MIEGMTAHDFEVENQDTNHIGADIFLDYPLRDFRAISYFGRIEIESIQQDAAGWKRISLKTCRQSEAGRQALKSPRGNLGIHAKSS